MTIFIEEGRGDGFGFNGDGCGDTVGGGWGDGINCGYSNGRGNGYGDGVAGDEDFRLAFPVGDGYGQYPFSLIIN